MQIRKTNKLLVPLIVALAGVLMKNSTALGVEARLETPPRVSDQDLRTFTRAAVEIDRIQAFYQLAIAQAAKTLSEQANAKIRGTLDKRQITVDEFERILQAVEQDPSLREKASRLARDEAEKRGQRQPSPPSAQPGEPAPPQNHPDHPAPPPSEELPAPGEITGLSGTRAGSPDV